MPITPRKFYCKPHCDGYIEIYEESDEAGNEKLVYFCSKENYTCRELSKQMNMDKLNKRLDNLEKILSKIDPSFSKNIEIQLMNAIDLAEYKKIHNIS